jgi:hypothetical protein
MVVGFTTTCTISQSLSWLGTDISIKSDKVKLVLLSQNSPLGEMIQSYKRFLHLFTVVIWPMFYFFIIVKIIPSYNYIVMWLICVYCILQDVNGKTSVLSPSSLISCTVMSTVPPEKSV